MPQSIDGYSVNPNGMLDSADELNVINNKLRTSLDDLQATYTTFANANAGAAIAGYDAAQAKWNQGMAEMQAALDSARLSLIQINQNYTHTDARGAAMFNGLV